MRYTLDVKTGCTEKLVELHKSRADEYGVPRPPHGERIYSGGDVSPWDVVIYEAEFESLTEYRAHMKETFAAPRMREWLDRVNELTLRGRRGELWTVEHLK